MASVPPTLCSAQTQTFGTRYAGFEPGTELSKTNLLSYLRSFMKDELPKLSPVTEDLPAQDAQYLEHTKMLKVTFSRPAPRPRPPSGRGQV